MLGMSPNRGRDAVSKNAPSPIVTAMTRVVTGMTDIDFRFEPALRGTGIDTVNVIKAKAWHSGMTAEDYEIRLTPRNVTISVVNRPHVRYEITDGNHLNLAFTAAAAVHRAFVCAAKRTLSTPFGHEINIATMTEYFAWDVFHKDHGTVHGKHPVLVTACMDAALMSLSMGIAAPSYPWIHGVLQETFGVVQVKDGVSIPLGTRQGKPRINSTRLLQVMMPIGRRSSTGVNCTMFDYDVVVEVPHFPGHPIGILQFGMPRSQVKRMVLRTRQDVALFIGRARYEAVMRGQLVIAPVEPELAWDEEGVL